MKRFVYVKYLILFLKLCAWHCTKLAREHLIWSIRPKILGMRYQTAPSVRTIGKTEIESITKTVHKSFCRNEIIFSASHSRGRLQISWSPCSSFCLPRKIPLHPSRLEGKHPDDSALLCSGQLTQRILGRTRWGPQNFVWAVHWRINQLSCRQSPDLSCQASFRISTPSL